MKIENQKLNRSILVAGVLLGAATIGNATVIGFGNLGGNNTNVEDRNATGATAAGARNYGSNATANGNGFVVANGATPNIMLSWGPGSEWDVHTSDFFLPIENKTAGGGAWDNEGGISRVAQLDYGGTSSTTGQFITFSVTDPSYALVLNSFDFGHTAEAGASATTAWNLSLTNSSLATVWSQTVSFTGGQVSTVTPNFTGELGQTYTLNFFRTAESYGSGGRHAIDNLSFNQIPEPSAVGLLGIAGLALLSRRRK